MKDYSYSERGKDILDYYWPAYCLFLWTMILNQVSRNLPAGRFINSSKIGPFSLSGNLGNSRFNLAKISLFSSFSDGAPIFCSVIPPAGSDTWISCGSSVKPGRGVSGNGIALV